MVIMIIINTKVYILVTKNVCKFHRISNLADIHVSPQKAVMDEYYHNIGYKPHLVIIKINPKFI